MNKYEIISFPIKNNSDKFSLFTKQNVVAVPYTSGMTLDEGQVTFDTDEKAYWIAPTIVSTSVNWRIGYIKYIDSIQASAGDDIEIEFEIKCPAGMPNSQKAGLTIDVLGESNNYLGSIYFSTYPTTSHDAEYKMYKFKKRIPPQYAGATSISVVIGTVTSADSTPYNFKIRNVKINLIRNSSVDLSNWIDVPLETGWVNNDASGVTDSKFMYKKEGKRIYVKGVVKQTVSDTNKTIGYLPFTANPRYYSNIVAMHSNGSILGLQLVDTKLQIRTGTLVLNNFVAFDFYYETK